MTLTQYIDKINTLYKTGNAREHSYRGDLQNLIMAILPDVLVTNEPARVDCGAPDYVLTRKDVPVGYIEAKDIGVDLGSKTLKEQFDRYKSGLSNLIFTDYMDFHFYKDGELTTKIAIAKIENGSIVPIVENFDQFNQLIKNFAETISQTIKSPTKLAQMMAGKARLMADVIEKSLNNDDQEGKRSQIKSQMLAFQQMLIHDIDNKSFSDIYAQTIAYGMFAARYHDPTLPTFSREEAATLIPKSNPFLRKLFQDIAGYDLDNRLVWIVDELVNIFLASDVALIMKNFGRSTKQEDPVVHFYETFLGEYNPALRKARAMDQELAQGKYRGPLHGIPYGIKDLLAVKDTKTTWGAMPYKDQVIDETATVVQKLEEAGGVLVGKFTLGALAMGDVWFGGVTKNPWNLKQGSSGSSAGSASAVSAGLVPFAIGTETLGSIVSPSTRNGVTGLRPTYGRVSKHGAMALSWSMDKIGPISRSTLDNAIVLSVINGMDEKDASTIPAAFNYSSKNEVKKLKIGYFKSFFEGDRPNIKNDQAVLEVLKNQGIELHPLELKTSINAAPLVSMLMVEGAAAFDELTRFNLDDQMVAQHRNAWPNLFRAARFIPAVEYVQMSRQRSILIKEMHELMKGYDVIVTPSFAGQQLQITNLTGHPALCLPNGFAPNGSPTSITLLANLFDEEKLIMVGRLIQENTDWQAKRPPMFDK